MEAGVKGIVNLLVAKCFLGDIGLKALGGKQNKTKLFMILDKIFYRECPSLFIRFMDSFLGWLSPVE